MWANPTRIEFLGTISKFNKRGKILSLLVQVLHDTWNSTFSRRSRAQTAKKFTKKVWCSCKVVVLLIKPVVSLFVCFVFVFCFSLPSRRWILKSLMFPANQEEVMSFDIWRRRQVDAHARCESKRSLAVVSGSLRSAASGLEKPLLAGCRLGERQSNMLLMITRKITITIMIAYIILRGMKNSLRRLLSRY